MVDLRGHRFAESRHDRQAQAVARRVYGPDGLGSGVGLEALPVPQGTSARRGGSRGRGREKLAERVEKKWKDLEAKAVAKAR